MDPVYLHLTVVHVPVIGIFFAAFALIFGIARRSEGAARVGLWMTIGCALGGWIALESGEKAEDPVEKLAGVNEQLIHVHEEIAEVAFWILAVAGVLALIGLFIAWRRKVLPRWVPMVVLLPVLASCVALTLTAERGGKIRHTEAKRPF